MSRTWEQEKAYNEKRAQELIAEMEQAIAECDKDRFSKAFTASMRYTTKKQRQPLYRRFLERMIGRA